MKIYFVNNNGVDVILNESKICKDNQTILEIIIGLLLSLTF